MPENKNMAQSPF